MKIKITEIKDWRDEYNYVGDFSEGFAEVRKGGKWGFVNKKGELVVPCEYDYVCSFSEGFAEVEKGEKTYKIEIK